MNQIPAHIAIIMDGNRRWAREHSLPPLAGHRKVAEEILEPLVEHAAKRGIGYMTFWAFSTENWQRSGSKRHHAAIAQQHTAVWQADARAGSKTWGDRRFVQV